MLIADRFDAERVALPAATLNAAGMAKSVREISRQFE